MPSTIVLRPSSVSTMSAAARAASVEPLSTAENVRFKGWYTHFTSTNFSNKASIMVIFGSGLESGGSGGSWIDK